MYVFFFKSTDSELNRGPTVHDTSIQLLEKITNSQNLYITNMHITILLQLCLKSS